MEYFSILTAGNLNDGSLCYIANPPEGMERHFARMVVGRAARKLVPQPARIRLRDEHPGIKLPGYIGNRKGFLIFNAAACAVISRMCPGKGMEILPFELINHKGRSHSTDYSIVNPVGGFDALNEAASTIDRGDDGRILDVPAIVLDPAKLASAPHLFRLAQKTTTYLFSEALVAALKEAEISNLVLRPVPQAPAAQP